MRLELYITRRAARELERIVVWWDKNRPAAPDAVVDDLERTLDVLLIRPDIGVSVVRLKRPGVRRVHLDRIRYWLYYRVHGSRLEVLSVWHSSRGSGPAI